MNRDLKFLGKIALIYMITYNLAFFLVVIIGSLFTFGEGVTSNNMKQLLIVLTVMLLISTPLMKVETKDNNVLAVHTYKLSLALLLLGLFFVLLSVIGAI